MHQQNSLAADQYISQLLDIWTALKREAYFRFVKFPTIFRVLLTGSAWPRLAQTLAHLDKDLSCLTYSLCQAPP